MNDTPLFRVSISKRAQMGIAALWLAISVGVGLTLGLPYGLFAGWAGLAAGAFVLNPLAAMLGLIILSVAAADWSQGFVLFPGKSYNINQAGLANLVMLGLAVVYVARRRPRLCPLAWPFLAFAAAGLISIPLSASPMAGLRDLSRIAPLAGVYLVTADLLRESPRRARLWVWAVVASSSWPALVAVYQFFTGTGYHNVQADPWINRLLGTLGHPIAYGAYLGLVIVLALFLFRETRRTAAKVALVGWVLFSMVLVFLTYSRGPALALGGSLLVFALFARREPWPTRGSVAVLAAAFLAFNVLGGRTSDLQRSYLYRQLTPIPETQLTPQATPKSTPVPTVVAGQLPTPSVDLGAKAQTFIEALAEERYEDAVAMFRPRSTPIIPQQFEEGWKNLASGYGEIRRVTVTAIREESQFWAVEISCDGSVKPLELYVLMDGTGTVWGIALPPAAAGTPAPRPTPAPTPGVVYGVNSFSWRLNLWRFGIDLALEQPITGIGLGAFPDQSPRLVGWRVTPHNDFVRVFTETGILGLGTYLWLWAALAWSLLSWWRRAPDRPQSLMAAALIAAAAGYFANSLSADLLNYPTMGWVFWSLMVLPEAFRQRPETSA